MVYLTQRYLKGRQETALAPHILMTVAGWVPLQRTASMSFCGRTRAAPMRLCHRTTPVRIAVCHRTSTATVCCVT
jgi:hypothetical protein